jgi:hypothetical protein
VCYRFTKNLESNYSDPFGFPWHSAPYPVDHDESSMLVICEKGFLENDTVFEKIDQAGELVF